MKIGILGSGNVAIALAPCFLKNGYDVTLGTRTARKLANGQKQPAGRCRQLQRRRQVRRPGGKARDRRDESDCRRSAGERRPEVLYAVGRVPARATQKEFPTVRFEKAFNSAGSAFFVDPNFRRGKPTMFICGNDDGSKQSVGNIVEQFGWEVADMGMAEAARAVELLCTLWCIPGFLRNERAHAFKLLK